MSIAYLFYGAYVVLACLGVLWWRPVGGELVLYDTARLAALLGLPFILLQPVLAARFRPLDRLVPLDKLLRWHRLTGIIGTTLILAHATLLFTYYSQFGLAMAIEFIKPGWKWETLGQISLDVMVATVGLALLRQTLRLPYHWWKRLHLVVYVAVFGGALHALMLGSDIAAKAGLRYYFITLMVISITAILYRRMLAPLLARRRPYQIETNSELVPGVRHLVLKPPLGKKLKYQPGQFAFIKFKSQGLSGEWHPFTISSAPSEPYLTFSIKASGDWTNQLSQVLPGDIVYIEGPFGKFTAPAVTASPDKQRNIVAVAGGIGITPLRSIMVELLAHNDPRRLTLLYANRQPTDIAFKKEFDHLAAQLPQRFKVIHVLSQAKDSLWTGETGYITADLIKKYVAAPIASEYFICGPKPMLQATVGLLRNLGVPRRQIHFELFSLV